MWSVSLTTRLKFPGNWCGKVEREGTFGEGITADDLVPAGGDVAVTSSNRERFVELYAQHLLEGSIERQFSAFRRGFQQACSPDCKGIKVLLGLLGSIRAEPRGACWKDVEETGVISTPFACHSTLTAVGSTRDYP